MWCGYRIFCCGDNSLQGKYNETVFTGDSGRVCQSLIGKVQLKIVKTFRGKDACQSLIGKVQHFGITIWLYRKSVYVSIPYREGTTTAFTPFVIAIIHQTPHFCNVFLKKVGRSPFLKV